MDNNLKSNAYKFMKDINSDMLTRFGLVEKYNVSLRKPLQQGISEPEFYDELGRVVRREQSSSIAIEQKNPQNLRCPSCKQ